MQGDRYGEYRICAVGLEGGDHHRDSEADQADSRVARRVERTDELGRRGRVRRFGGVARRRFKVDAFRDGRGGTPFDTARAVASKEQYH